MNQAPKLTYPNANKSLSKDDINKIKIVFDALEKDPQVYDFLEPVDYVGNK
jgi:hypothetical protein